ncbi:MAG UNVERIFIED_CONTAM: hypothetical protein LVR29_03330 [Microcystis novacekii LVE1205-3]|jgi:diacylglycerol kinase family enzyme
MLPAWPGIGFEAETVQEADRKLKNEFGILAYILAGLDRLQNLVPFTAEIATENEKFTVSAAAVTVANIARLRQFWLRESVKPSQTMVY